MKHVLAKGHAAGVLRFLRARVLLAFDFDGTLAPIVADRDAARMRRRTIELLERVCRTYPCAVITGRRAEDVLPRLEGVPVHRVIGQHGLELRKTSRALERQVRTARAHLTRTLRRLAGVELEDKVHSIAVHYRGARDRSAAREIIEPALAPLRCAFRIVPGKGVYDVIPAEAPHKGDALEALVSSSRLDAAVYVGDDATDEDVFRQAHPERLLAIRIGRSRRSAAPYYLQDQRELDVFLGYVINRAGF